jgi:hypothetical protein
VLGGGALTPEQGAALLVPREPAAPALGTGSRHGAPMQILGADG